MFIGAWKVFEKAGEPGYLSLVPIYNAMVLARIVGKEETFGLLACIPIAGIYFGIIMLLELAKRFGVGGGFVAGLILLPMVFWPMLGFGSYTFSRGGKRRRRAAVRDEDEDEEEERPRRRSRARDEEEDEDDRPRRPRGRDSGISEDRPRRRRRDEDDEDDE